MIQCNVQAWLKDISVAESVEPIQHAAGLVLLKSIILHYGLAILSLYIISEAAICRGNLERLALYSTEEQCEAALEKARWPNGLH